MRDSFEITEPQTAGFSFPWVGPKAHAELRTGSMTEIAILQQLGKKGRVPLIASMFLVESPTMVLALADSAITNRLGIVHTMLDRFQGT